jgi:hypothetical protein
MPNNDKVSVDSRSAVKENPDGMQKSEPHITLVMSCVETHPGGQKSPFSIKCLTARPYDQSSLRGKFPKGLTIKRLKHQRDARVTISITAMLQGIEEAAFDFVNIYFPFNTFILPKAKVQRPNSP